MIATIQFEIESKLMTEDEMKKVLIEKMAYEMDEWICGERIFEIEFELKKEKNEDLDEFVGIIN
tara:strand:- start:53 stop:244 length:192 start_codon:yes stop_codon:yes gene_type:complete